MRGFRIERGEERANSQEFAVNLQLYYDEILNLFVKERVG